MTFVLFVFRFVLFVLRFVLFVFRFVLFVIFRYFSIFGYTKWLHPNLLIYNILITTVTNVTIFIINIRRENKKIYF